MNVVKSKDITTCTEHKSEEIRFYCSDCDVFICDDCVTESGRHSTCKKIKISEYSRMQRQSTYDLVTKAKEEDLVKIKKIINKADDAKQSFNCAVENEISSVRSKRDLIRRILDEIQDEVVTDFNNSRNAANDKFDEFSKMHTQRYNEIKHILDDIELEGSGIPAHKIALYGSKLKELLTSDLEAEQVPKIEKPKHVFHNHYLNKDNLRIMIGFLDYGEYDEPDVVQTPSQNEVKSHMTDSSSFVKDSHAVSSTKRSNDKQNIDQKENNLSHNDVSLLSGPLDNTDERGSDFYEQSSSENQMDQRKNKFEIVKSFKFDKNIFNIVPTGKDYQVWLVVQNGIYELDLSADKSVHTLLLSSLGVTPVTAARSKTHGLLLGLPKKNSIQRLYCTGTMRRNTTGKLLSHISVPSNNLSAICTSSSSGTDVAICLKNYKSGNQTVIRWYSSQPKPIMHEISLQHDIQIEYPVHISEHTNGDICITCSPEDKASWIVLVDNSGNQKMRYPTEEVTNNDRRMLYSFIGAEFLKDGTITILDRVKFRQHHITSKGKVLDIDSYTDQPSCFAVDNQDLIWVGFDGGKIQLMGYSNLLYEEVVVRNSSSN